MVFSQRALSRINTWGVASLGPQATVREAFGQELG